MWIDRVVTELDDGPDVLELHPRLTVLSSPDRDRRRAPFDRVDAALRGERGAHLEVHTENGDPVVALRPLEGEFQLIDPDLEEELDPDSLARSGIVGQLNSAAAMIAHLRLLRVTATAMRERAIADAQLLHLAQTPIDRLWTIANEIQTNRHILHHTEAEGSNLHQAVRERESIEETYSDLIEKQEDHLRRTQLAYLAAGVSLAIAALVAASFNPLFVVPPVLIGAGLAAHAYFASRSRHLDEQQAELTQRFGGSGFGVQLGRIDELFTTTSIYRKQREARDNLQRSLDLWHELAGGAEPTVLINERPRLEELAGHLRIIGNEQTVEADPRDREVLDGFASLLAELSRRFPTERVPILIEDLFAELHAEYHATLRVLLTRAAHRRQVVLETADSAVARWAAAEAVAGDAMLITDQPISVTSLLGEPGEPTDDAV